MGAWRDLTVRDNRLVGIVLVGTQDAGAVNEDNRVTHNRRLGHRVRLGHVPAGRARQPPRRQPGEGQPREHRGLLRRRNTVVANSVSGGFNGVLLYNSSHNLVAGNTVADSDVGIDAVGSAADNRIEHNGIARTQAGIVLESSEFSSGSRRATASPATRSPRSPTASSCSRPRAPSVTGNVVTAAGRFGDPDTGGFGIVLDGASHGVVDRNAVVGARGPGISVGVEGDGSSALPPLGNAVSRNTVAHGAVDGIVVLGAARDTTVERNTAYRNGADGISVLSPFTTVARNRADRNAAVRHRGRPGRDGRRREPRARQRQSRPQCIGVACN